MLQTKIISEDLCAVSFEPTEIMVRRRGKINYGTERTLVDIKDGKLFIHEDVAHAFGVEIVRTEIQG